MKSEFIFQSAPIGSCHASTVVETYDGLVASWFAGSAEGNSDISIWISRHPNGVWTVPALMADGIESPILRYSCWHPVMIQPESGQLLFLYKIGPPRAPGEV